MTIRLLVATVLSVAAALGVSAAPAMACGSDGGYSYAGVSAQTHAFGVRAEVTPLNGFDVVSGHVAGWVGVGGPGQGPGGRDEWLQIGLSGFPGSTTSDVYYELTVPGANPSYHQLATALPVGRAVRVAVLEMHNRPNWWRVWLNGAPASDPLHLPGSHDRWSPIATAESWDGGTGGACNGFLYSFKGVSIAGSPGGGWRSLAQAYDITGPSTKLRRADANGAFLAAEGDTAIRSLSGVRP